jgi:hypothetical protein
MVKNKGDNSCFNCIPNVDLEDYTKVDIILAFKNYELIEKAEYIVIG